jgi:hypothetical protein
MTPMMHERVRNLFSDAGLTAGFTVQQLMYEDPGKLAEAVMVFRPNGGPISVMISDLSITLSWMSLVQKISEKLLWMLCSVSLTTSRLTPSPIAVSAISKIWGHPATGINRRGKDSFPTSIRVYVRRVNGIIEQWLG